MEKVILGLSGGVDSAVSARLLQQQGLEVEGLFLDVGSQEARQDALGVADFLGIHLHILDISQQLEELVCSPFARSYFRGETPNPCILCNRAVKFKALCDCADERQARFIATGHYAKTKDGALYKGHPSNDQSYMLCRITPSCLSRLLLPLGDYPKEQVRQMAQQLGIPVAQKPDSMEICFIPEKDYISWLEKRGCTAPPGDFVFHGQVIGRHEGIHRYTVGQRRPGLYNERKLYISAICPETNTIQLALWEELFKTQLQVRDVSWLVPTPEGPLRGSVKVRHTKWECPPCTIIPQGDGALVSADEPLRAPARGQAAVFYDGDRVLGGGFII